MEIKRFLVVDKRDGYDKAIKLYLLCSNKVNPIVIAGSYTNNLHK